MARHKRIEHGRPLDFKPAPAARAADALALLSGVNFSSVVKVLAAIEALKKTGLTAEEIVKFQSIPLIPVDFDGVHLDGEHEARAEATDNLVSSIVKSGQANYLDYVLRLERRFSGGKRQWPTFGRTTTGTR